MNLLKEMLEISAFNVLVEDFGNLKQIDKNLLKAMMSQIYVNNKNGKANYVDKFLVNAGRNSEVKEVEIKNSKTVTSEFENPNLLGAVIFDKVSGTQYGMVGIKTFKTHKSEKKMGLAVNYVALSGENPRPDDIRHHRSVVWDELKATKEVEKTYLTADRDFKDAQVAKVVNLIRNRADLWKRNGKDVKLFVKFIYSDATRPIAKKERIERKAGIIPVKLVGADLENFKKSAMASLKNRLDAYKRDKLKNSGNSIDFKDFAKEVKNAGFLDKFLVNGFVFNYYDDQINFSKMRAGEHKQNSSGHVDPSYITYRVDDKSEEYVALRDKYWDARAKLTNEFRDDNEAYTKEHDKLKKRLKVPPTRIKVLLDLEGGAIVPYDIEMDYSGI